MKYVRKYFNRYIDIVSVNGIILGDEKPIEFPWTLCEDQRLLFQD